MLRLGREAGGSFGLDVDPSVMEGDGKVRVAGHRGPRDGRTIERGILNGERRYAPTVHDQIGTVFTIIGIRNHLAGAGEHWGIVALVDHASGLPVASHSYREEGGEPAAVQKIPAGPARP